MDNKVVNALATAVTAQNRKKLKVYTACLDHSRGTPDHRRSLGSMNANTSISNTPATRNAGHTIHMIRCCNMGHLVQN
jgi:hypothetical protein